MESFSRATRAWFEESFGAPTEVQRRGWEPIVRGFHALLVAPTGSGKTLAAFLAGIDRLARRPAGGPAGVRVLYLSPLKALAADIERNLRAPLAGIRRAAERLGEPFEEIRVDVRTGDTPQRERQRQARHPGEILVTTPESLFLILGSGARTALATVEVVIVDEINAQAPSKRGVHLALSLERLAELTGRDPQRIGLSATVRPLDEVARFLGGERPVELVDASAPPRLALEIRVPVPDLQNPPAAQAPERGGPVLAKKYASLTTSPANERGIWPALYPELLREVQAHRSTIFFVNSRGLCERLAQRLNELAGKELVLAHHGSVSHERRGEIENALKEGRLRGIVATSSLELGIDMGAVDRVVLVESPGSVARGLQRVGRAGHSVGETSSGALYPKFRGDLLESAVIARRMLRGEIEALRVPRNALDVLAQQIVAMCCDRPRSSAELAALVRRCHPFRELSRAALTAVLDMLAGSFPSTDFADLRPRLSWDRAADQLAPRRGTAMVSRLNAGTLPDRGAYPVHLGADGPRIGELEEEMVCESRDGDTFVLGASTWRVEEITRDRVVVSPAPGEAGRMPFWKGDGPGRPLELGRALGAFVRELGELAPEAAAAWLQAELPLDRFAAENLAAYVQEQRAHTGTLPTDRALTVERFRDELGDWRICLLSPHGSPVHAPWALAIQRLLAQRSGVEVEVMYTDDGIVLRLADLDEAPDLQALLPDPDEVEELVTEVLDGTSLFAALFRENAVRSLLVPRRRPEQRSPLWAQRVKTRALLAAVRHYPGFPIVLETFRQALSDVFDVPGLRDLLRRVRSREVRVVEVETRSPSPFARSLVFAYTAAYLYQGDSPAAERRAQALTLDRRLLNELVGQAELRELLDPEALAELEAELAGTAEGRRARDHDELHDLLRRLGDLSPAELAARSTAAPEPWLERLRHERRAALVSVAGERRWIAAEEAGLYRDALGCAPPGGLPERFLAPVRGGADEALLSLVRRFARTHGPFVLGELAARFGLRTATLQPLQRRLEEEGALVRGELRPAGRELEWCDAEVLRTLKRRTLAKLRREVAAVDAATLGRFLPAWHGLTTPPDCGHEPERLEEALLRLEGLALPWRALSQVLLPMRVPRFRPEALDLLSAAGSHVWVGAAPLGTSDGWVRLYRRESVARLHAPAAAPPPEEPLQAALLAHLAERGASFLVELERGARARLSAPHADPGARELEAALWDLVWAGLVTNDTFQPLRALGGRPAGPRPVVGAGAGGRTRQAWRSALGGGRWWRVADLAGSAVSDTERSLARAHMLLERYGIVSHDAALAEELPGGFGPLGKVLRSLEEAGRIRRGHFVDGLTGAQFGQVGAVERLRALRREPGAGGPDAATPAVLVLAALDPANPYGALLPWPPGAREDLRPRRVSGAWVVLVDGRPAVWVAPRRRSLLTFPSSVEAGALVQALRALTHLPVRGRRGRLALEEVDGVPVLDSPLLGALLEAGFVRDYRALVPGPEGGTGPGPRGAGAPGGAPG